MTIMMMMMMMMTTITITTVIMFTEPVLENKEMKPHWNRASITNKHVTRCQPDMVLGLNYSSGA